MAYYLISKRGVPVSKDDIEEALKSHCENPPNPNKTETNGLWAVDMDGETANKLIGDGFSVQICLGFSASTS